MNNLIITTIAVILLAILAVVGTYYGGRAFLELRTEAHAVQYFNEAEQLMTAFWQHRFDHLTDIPTRNTPAAFLAQGAAPSDRYINSYPDRTWKGEQADWILTPDYLVKTVGRAVAGANRCGDAIRICWAARRIAEFDAPEPPASCAAADVIAEGSILACHEASSDDPCCICTADAIAANASECYQAGDLPEDDP